MKGRELTLTFLSLAIDVVCGPNEYFWTVNDAKRHDSKRVQVGVGARECQLWARALIDFYLVVQLDWTSNTSRQKTIFASKPEELRHFRDHRWKVLGEENPNLI